MTRETKPSRYKWRYGPLRLVMPWLCIVVGIAMAIRGAFGLSTNSGADPTPSYLGIALISLGIVAFFVYRWMAKRSL